MGMLLTSMSFGERDPYVVHSNFCVRKLVIISLDGKSLLERARL